MFLKRYLLNEMSWVEAEAAFKAAETAIVPVGSVEEHGPHLPLGTDNIVAYEVAKRVGEALGAVVLPPLPYGYSWGLAMFPGTISIGPATLTAFAHDIVENLVRWGVKKIVFISGHAENNPILIRAAQEFSSQFDVKTAVLSQASFAPEVIESIREAIPPQPEPVHACEIETSWMLAIAPHLVHMEKAVVEYPKIPRESSFAVKPMGMFTKSGVFGDSTKATQDKGERLLSASVPKIVDFIKSL